MFVYRWEGRWEVSETDSFCIVFSRRWSVCSRSHGTDLVFSTLGALVGGVWRQKCQRSHFTWYIFMLWFLVIRSGKLLHFKGSSFHRVIPGFMCQVRSHSQLLVVLKFRRLFLFFSFVLSKGGDFTRGNGRGTWYKSMSVLSFSSSRIERFKSFILWCQTNVVGGESIYGEKFADENFIVSSVSMLLM